MKDLCYDSIIIEREQHADSCEILSRDEELFSEFARCQRSAAHVSRCANLALSLSTNFNLYGLACLGARALALHLLADGFLLQVFMV
jgi:hypothetical protein